jgi:hypothetical protein
VEVETMVLMDSKGKDENNLRFFQALKYVMVFAP